MAGDAVPLDVRRLRNAVRRIAADGLPRPPEAPVLRGLRPLRKAGAFGELAGMTDRALARYRVEQWGESLLAPPGEDEPPHRRSPAAARAASRRAEHLRTTKETSSMTDRMILASHVAILASIIFVASLGGAPAGIGFACSWALLDAIVLRARPSAARRGYLVGSLAIATGILALITVFVLRA